MPSQGHPRIALRRRRDGAGPRRLLITGTRGSGKRPVGNYLAFEHGFAHVDLDDAATRARFAGEGEEGLRAALAALGPRDLPVVVTWELGSGRQLETVRRLQKLGFEWIWFDSDRGSVLGSVLADAGRDGPRFVDTFTPAGRFRPIEPVVAEVLDRTAGRRLQPATSRTRRARAATRGRVAAVAAAALALGSAAGALVLAGLPGGGEARVAEAHGALPARGVLVSGRSLAGIRLGDSPGAVRAAWGHAFTLCRVCDQTTWFYLPPAAEGSGAGVRFRAGQVTAVFTLGSPRGWRTADGLRVGQLLQRFNDPSDTSTWQYCGSYGAKSTSSSGAVTSILTLGQSVYGFALTRPDESVCL